MEHLQTQAPVENNSWSPWSQEGTSGLTRHLSSLSSPLSRIDSLPRTNDSSLFSSSLPNMFHSKMKLSEAEEAVSDGMHKEDECLEDLESRTIGNLLPDEDELLDGIEEYTVEDVDIFSSGGGLEMDAQDNYGFVNGYGFQHVNNGPLVAGEHPAGEHPSRTLFVRNINSNVEDSELRSLFEQYGDIRQVYSASKHRGFVMISYYDIRAARNAIRGLQGRLVRRRKLNIHFAIPKDHPSDKDMNQGTLVVFNLDASVSNNDLLEIFGAYGEVKEIRETPHKRHHKFIEFFDVRHADAALKALNRSDIAGKRIKLEHSRPGGTRRTTSSLMQQHTQEQEESAWPSSAPVNGGPHPWNGYNHLENGYYKSSKLANGTVSSPTLRNSVIGNHAVKHGIFSPHHPQSLPEYNTGVMGHYASGGNMMSGASSAVFRTESFEGSHFKRASNENPRYGHIGSVRGTNMNGHGNSNGNGSLSSHQFLWGTSSSYNGWPTSFDHGHAHSFSSFQSPTLGTSAPLDHSPYIPEASSDTNLLGVHNSYGHIPSVLSPHHRSRMYPSSSFENGYARRRAQETNTEQFHLDLERILNGEDTRTTLMIKNIPNKYTSKMLLAAIDEYHRGTYDFLYLPIDFKNKCNVGYAFINMISPLSIIPFYQAFQGKKWEKFNSEKVASLAYARIQGKAALVAHFQNSSLLNEDKRCRPILFHSDGAGEQEPVPMGTNLRIRTVRNNGSQQGSPTSSSPKDRLF